MPIAEACTLVDASLEHEACACTGRGAEARTYTPLVSRVVITLIAASFGDGLLHLGLASVASVCTALNASCTSTSSHGPSERRDLKLSVHGTAAGNSCTAECAFATRSQQY